MIRRMRSSKQKLKLIKKYLQKDSLRKLTRQGLWICQYARRYWKAMVLYTLLGVMGTGVSLVSSLISKDLVDIITGHEDGGEFNQVHLRQ